MPPGDTEFKVGEKPAHQVTITKGFWMGQTEVTVGAYKRFAAATGRQMPPEPNFFGAPLNPLWGNENLPMVNVTRDDALAYCRWTGGRLPTEAEWEYAARAGSAGVRYGDLDEIAWHVDNCGRLRIDGAWIRKKDPENYRKSLIENGNSMHEVGQKLANDFGLYDMLGNVSEYVNDWFDVNYYQNSPSQDPAGPPSGPWHVVRGGSWQDALRDIRASSRLAEGPAGMVCEFIGFRCVWEPAGP